MDAGIVQLSNSSFEDAIQGQTPILVDFWAAWCGPCRMIAPVLEAVAVEYRGKARIAKLNVDDNGETASRLGVRSIPTLILFKNGREADRIIGQVPKEAITRLLDQHL
jgi:thioredoxin 1